MESIYPAGPANVPADLTKPSKRYRQKAWLAMLGLGLFVLLYCALSGWFAWQAWRLMRGVFLGHGGEGFIPFVVGIASAFFAVFMLKALFFIKHGGQPDDVEVTAQQEPQLFEFLHRLADEAGAPRPHRVFLSPRVNASVFYDLSILNLLWPSRKNLEIGLALVNVLSLGELKAVLAHEFGHFAQRSMAVGRWVYIAQQIAGQIIGKRDALDRFLQGLSNFDIRIAWIGWLMSLIVWAIRTLLETAFRLVVLAQRALSREMEMQADLVAVSLTGSDALIHALHRMEAADDAWDRTLGFANGEFAKGRKVSDLFAIQSRVIAHLRVVFNDPGYGKEPPRAKVPADQHRVFSAELARPPQMWATHPLNHERENNAKRVYLAAPVDSRSAWQLFKNPASLRKQVSDHMIRHADKQPAAVPLETSLQTLDELFQREDLNRFYRGVYLGRSVTRHVQRPEELYEKIRDVSMDDLAALYPESLTRTLEKLRNLEKEKALLESIQAGTMKATDGVIRHRGQSLRRRHLPKAIAEVSRELDEVEQSLFAHDRRCRSVHRAFARKLGGEWEPYLLGLAALLHYADHSEADLRDAHGEFSNVVAIETATGKVSKQGVNRVIAAGNRLHTVMAETHRHRAEVLPDPSVLQRMETGSWEDALGKFDLPLASRDNINEWVKVIDGWVDAKANAFSSLRRAALCQLLSTEAQLARDFREGKASAEADSVSKTPLRYATLLPRQHRKRQTQLGWWARFQRADGAIATVARLAVSVSIVGVVLGFGGVAGMAHLTIYNGLARNVVVSVNEQRVELPQFGHETIDIPADGQLKIETRTTQGLVIDELPTTLDGGASRYVYNIAGASPLVEWTANYGSYGPVAPRKLGAQRWLASSANHLFEEPPQTISSKSGGGLRTVLTGLGDQPPAAQLNQLEDNDDAGAKAMILAHARWDAPGAPGTMYWLGLASRYPDYSQLLALKLEEAPRDVLLLRAEQDLPGTLHYNACLRQLALADKTQDDANLQYLAIRCQKDDERQAAAFLAGEQRWPDNPWFALGVGYTYAEQGDWANALNRLETAYQRLPAVREWVGLDIARINRLRGRSIPPEMVEHSFALQRIMALESGKDVSEPLRALSELGQGNINAAMAHAKSEPAIADRILRLAAASDGAEPDLIKRALSLDNKRGLDSRTAWPMLALALREKANAEPYREQLRQEDPEGTRYIVAFADALATGSTPQEAEKILQGTSLYTRATAYGMGTIMLGKAAPAAWRERAQKLLFPSERPFLL